MDNGIYIALSRQLALFREMSTTAHNLANVDTTGFNAEKVMFDDYLVKGGDGPKLAFTNDVSSYRDLSEGALKTTGNPLDVAISGPGYFTVQTPLGERYTRAGNFQLDAAGTLVTADGNPVLNEGGQPIVFQPEDDDISIGSSGDIKVNGEQRDRISVVEFPNEQMLERVGASMYKTDIAPSPADKSRVLHGVLEGSNVKPVLELTHMIEVSRGVASTAKLIESQYDLERKTASTWAKSQ